MRTLFFGALGALILASHSFAAPVPKESPEAALKRIYGAVDNESKVEWEMKIGSSLRLTLPPAPASDSHSIGKAPIVFKEVVGDFSVIVRVQFHLDESTSSTPRQSVPSLSAGLSFSTTDGSEWIPVTSGRYRHELEWKPDLGRASNTSGLTMKGGETDNTKAKGDYIRLTREKKRFSAYRSEDGKRWERDFAGVYEEAADTLRVGPIAFHKSDRKFTAQFDEYELKLLNEEGKK